MLHAKSQDHMSRWVLEKMFLKVFTINGCGGHLGHMTRIIYKNFAYPFPWNISTAILPLLLIEEEQLSVNN